VALDVGSYALDGHAVEPRPGFTRRTTVVRLRGAGEEGLGEDVTYDAASQLAQQERGPVLPLAGEHTLESFSELLDGVDLAAPGHEVEHRRWAYESAALDLALRQAGRSLAEALGREPRPVRYVVSKGLGSEPSATPLRLLLELYPEARFKLDAARSWTDGLIVELAGLGRTDVVDFKGVFRGEFGEPPDAGLYARVAAAFPDAWLEDPGLTPETDEALAPHRDRITWDAPIHSVADVEALPFAPRTLNVKPSRFGTVRALLDFYDHCEGRGIALYGGGQFELGVGRGQIQLLAALFHPDAPNDVAPAAFNEPEPPPGLERSPLGPTPEPVGFRRRARG
jgi:L-alanine-DL-glutamate epimerase-like enolase superfamily enzyme